MAYRVPFVDPRTHYRRLKSEIDAAITDCLSKGDLILRQQLRDFEAHLAEYVGVQYAVGLNSGYHALHFALLGAGIGPEMKSLRLLILSWPRYQLLFTVARCLS